ncbi:hypothetical protein LCGC14_2482330, partial [marine sediment metagenome]
MSGTPIDIAAFDPGLSATGFVVVRVSRPSHLGDEASPNQPYIPNGGSIEILDHTTIRSRAKDDLPARILGLKVHVA